MLIFGKLVHLLGKKILKKCTWACVKKKLPPIANNMQM